MMKRAVKRVLLAVFSFVLVFGATPVLFAAPEKSAETIETDKERFTITEDNENITKKKDRDEKAKPFNFEGETDRKLEINHESPQITNTETEKKSRRTTKSRLPKIPPIVKIPKIRKKIAKITIIKIKPTNQKQKY